MTQIFNAYMYFDAYYLLIIGPVARSCCHSTYNQLARYENYAIITKGILAIVGKILRQLNARVFERRVLLLMGLFPQF